VGGGVGRGALPSRVGVREGGGPPIPE
jgi:hypothetical protein